MKALNKLALAAAISAAPFAQAELTSIDDALLGDMTGQAGISIELTTGVSIGSLVYTDTDGLALLKGGSATAGSVTMSNIQFGGGAVAGGAGGSLFDEVLIDIDVDAVGGIIIHLGGTNTPGVIDGTASVDFGLHLDSISASGLNQPLVGNVNIAGRLGPVDVSINNTTGEDLVAVKAFFEVTSGNMDVAVAGLGITSLTVGQNSAPIQASPYATAIGQLIGAGASANSTGVDNMAYAEVTVGTKTVNFFNLATGAGDSVAKALSIDIVALDMDINMGVSLGGRDIGTVAINDLNLAGTELNIFGH